MKYLYTLALLLIPLSAIAEPVIVSETTDEPITFKMVDDTGAAVTSPTITAVYYRKGTSTTNTAMTTPTTGAVTNGNGLWYLIADEGTTISTGLAEENIDFTIVASDAEPAHVRATIKAAQETTSGLVTAILQGLFTADPEDYDAADNLADLFLRMLKTGKSYTVDSEHEPTSNVTYTEE